jgi:hypothetical protein
MLKTILQKTLDVFQKNFLRIIGYNILFNLLKVLLMPFILTITFVPCVTIAHTHAKIAMARGEPVSIGNSLNEGFSLGIRPFIYNIVWTINMTVGFLVFIIPGLYLLSSWFYSSALLIDERHGVEDTLHKSSKIAKHMGLLTPYKIGLTLFSILLLSVVFLGLVLPKDPSSSSLIIDLIAIIILLLLLAYFSMIQACTYVIAKASFEEATQS